MSYKIAAIDIHKRVLMVVVASTPDEVVDATGAAVEFELRRFGAATQERNHLVSWLQQHQVREVVMESHNPTAHPKDARTIFRTPSVWRAVCSPAN